MLAVACQYASNAPEVLGADGSYAGRMTSAIVSRVEPADGNLIRLVRLRALATDPASFGSTFEHETAYPD